MPHKFLCRSIVFVCTIFISLTIGCTEGSKSDVPASPSVLRLATTTSTEDSGLLGTLIPRFEQKYGVTVEILVRGTGAALQLGREGKADVLLVHAREAEDTFLVEGFGINRRDVMYNDFVLLGPPSDPAEILATQTIDQAFNRLLKRKVLFLSRGDNSGTDIREQALWQNNNLTPDGNRYQRTGEGMLETLRAASQHKAYILTDRSTYLYNRDSLDLQIVFEGDRQLYNPYGVIAVNPRQVDGVNYQAAMAFVDFITSEEAQEMIGHFGEKRVGAPLFTPMAHSIRETK